MCKKIAFVGAGSMAEAMISGITARGEWKPGQISVTNRENAERLNFLRDAYHVHTTLSYEELFRDAGIVVIAVKPKDLFTALDAIKQYLRKDMLLLSVAAGVSMASLEKITGQELAVIRSMPNTSAAIGKSATAISCNSHVTKSQLDTAVSLLETIGTVTLVEERHLDAVTGLSGSGPAYIYYMIEAMQQSAAEIGLDEAAAKQLIIQTLAGAADMLKQSPKAPGTLRREITSPGGTTEAGLKILQDKAFRETMIECIVEATRQSKRLGEKLSEEIDKKSISV